MRLRYASLKKAELEGKEYRVFARPLQAGNALANQGYGEESGETIRVLFPFFAAVHERDHMTLDKKHYLCIGVRAYPGHVQADFLRRAL